MITSLRNSPSFRQKRSSFVTVIPPTAGGGGYVNNLVAKTFHIQFQILSQLKRLCMLANFVMLNQLFLTLFYYSCSDETTVQPYIE